MFVELCDCLGRPSSEGCWKLYAEVGLFVLLLLLVVVVIVVLVLVPVLLEATIEERNDGGRTLCTKGLKAYGIDGSVTDLVLEEVLKRLERFNLLPRKGEAAKGGGGIPVNSCTMARKLDVSVVRTVVGALREARVRFLGLRTPTLLRCDEDGDGADVRGLCSCPDDDGMNDWLCIRCGDGEEVIRPAVVGELVEDVKLLDKTMSRFSREFGVAGGFD